MLKKSLNGRASGVQIVEDNVELEEVAFAMDDSKTLNEVVTIGYAVENETTSKEEKSNQEKPDFDTVQIRKNLQETAFFFPQLQTDENGIPHSLAPTAPQGGRQNVVDAILDDHELRWVFCVQLVEKDERNCLQGDSQLGNCQRLQSNEPSKKN